MTLLLTQQELIEATGRVKPAAQAKALSKMGFECKRSPCGRLLVSRTHFEEVLGAKENTANDFIDNDWKIFPDLPSNVVPDVWFLENVHSFIHPKSLIINEAIPYNFGDGTTKSGVYFLIHGETIIYVGISGNIQQRIAQHFDKGWDIQKFWCFGGVPKEYIEHIEAYYIHLHQPHFNVKYPELHSIVKPLLEQELIKSR